MKGWHTQVAGEYERPTGVIGVVVAPKFPDLEIIREKIREGVERRPDDVWVIREKPQANHAVNAVWETLDEAGVEPLLVPLVDAWRLRPSVRETKIAVVGIDECEQNGQWLTFHEPDETTYDLRRKWADAELGATCERIIVFHDKSSQVTASWGDPSVPRIARVFVIERGAKKTVKRRTGRKPVGA